MGGRGASANGGRGASAKPGKKQGGGNKRKSTSNSQEYDSRKAASGRLGKNLTERLTNYIKYWTGVDIENYRTDGTKHFDGRTGVNLKWDLVDTAAKNQLRSLSTEGYFEMRDNGWMRELKFGKKLKQK